MEPIFLTSLAFLGWYLYVHKLFSGWSQPPGLFDIALKFINKKSEQDLIVYRWANLRLRKTHWFELISTVFNQAGFCHDKSSIKISCNYIDTLFKQLALKFINAKTIHIENIQPFLEKYILLLNIWLLRATSKPRKQISLTILTIVGINWVETDFLK